MSKLKDYKDKIPNWPEKKGLCCAEEFNILSNEAYALKTENNILHDKLLDIIENLEFNPAELVELSKDKIVQAIAEMRGLKKGRFDRTAENRKIAQAIVDRKKDILK